MWTSVVFNACLIHVAILECIVKNLDVQIHSHTGHQACKFFVFGEPGSEPKKSPGAKKKKEGREKRKKGEKRKKREEESKYGKKKVKRNQRTREKGA